MHDKTWFKRGVVATLIALTSFGGVAIAQDDSVTRRTKLATTQGTTEQENAVDAERLKARSQAEQLRRAAKSQNRLVEAKKAACEKVEDKLIKHTANVIRHTEKQLEVFDRAVEKVQQFAVDKKITVTDEAALLADIKTARDKVAADLAALKAEAAFDCDSDNPKGQIEAFKADVKLIRADLKAYRLTVRKFIQAVRQANGQNRDRSESSSTETDNEVKPATNSPAGAQ